MVFPVHEISLAWVALPDNRRLSARVWLPDVNGPWPAVVEYQPYGTSWIAHDRDGRRARPLAERGLAVVRVDIAGSGESDGLIVDEYTAEEISDGAAVVDWVAAQPWCTGAVALTGISWSGFSALQIAAHNPSALRAIFPNCASDDRYADDVHYMGGLPVGYDFAVWATIAQGFFISCPDPDVVGDTWLETWRRRLEAPPVLVKWLSHQHRDAYWQHGSVADAVERLTVPTLFAGGFEDGYRDAVLRLVRERPDLVTGLIGPWGHAMPDQEGPGPVVEGWHDVAAQWFHHYLDEPGAAPADPTEGVGLMVYLQEPRRPREHLTHRPGRWLALSEDEVLVQPSLTLAGADSMRPSSPLLVPWSHLHGSASPIWCPYGDPTDFALDQAVEDAVCGTLDWALEDDLVLVGQAAAHMRLRTDAPTSQVAVRLCDVWPDGASTLVAYGVLNLTHRDSHQHPAPVPVDEDLDVTVLLRSTGYRFPAGHRLRLSIAPGYWPTAWPSAQPATLAVFPEFCRLELPTCVAERPVPEWLRSAAPSGDEPEDVKQRTVERDFATDVVTQRMTSHTGDIQLPGGATCSISEDHVLSLGPDPTSAFATSVVTMTRGRGDWQVSWEASSRVTCTSTDFVVDVAVRAEHGDEVVHASSEQHKIPRDLC